MNYLSERDYAKEHEEALAESATEKAEVRKQYSIRDAVRRASEIVSVLDETLGEVRFGVLSIAEFEALDLSQCKTKEGMLRVVIHAMLKKAEPTLTLADVEGLPADDYTIITGIISSRLPGFLRVGQQILKTSSTPT